MDIRGVENNVSRTPVVAKKTQAGVKAGSGDKEEE